MGMKPQLVMIVIPNNKGDHYAAVKTKCCVERPIPSQCITATVLGKPKGLMSVATKVALQMNCKLGGEPWAVKIPLKNTMILGYDTYHDTVRRTSRLVLWWHLSMRLSRDSSRQLISMRELVKSWTTP